MIWMVELIRPCSSSESGAVLGFQWLMVVPALGGMRAGVIVDLMKQLPIL